MRSVAENRADRHRDVGGRQAGGRNLLKKRLEQVMIVAIDNRHGDPAFGQDLSRLEAGESGAGDDHARDAGSGFGNSHFATTANFARPIKSSYNYNINQKIGLA